MLAGMGRLAILLLLVASACGLGSPSGDGDTGIDAGGTSDAGDGDGDGDGDEFGMPDVGGESCDSWDVEWIGGPCGHDDDCSYDGGFCLMEAEGFPCGTCSLPCELYCPDLEGTPTTFCIDSSDVELAPPEGLCVSQCDPGLLGGDGCREGYACVALPRWDDPGTSTGVCIPDDLAPEQGTCLEKLEARGLVFEPTVVDPESPDGFPELLCEIEDPVLLYPPIAGVSWRYIDSMSEAPVLVSCETALAIADMSELLDQLGAVEFQHIGTYNCRVIGGTDSLSMHGLAAAIDLYGFTLFDDTWYTIFDDWEDGVAMPMTPGGQWLKELADTMFAQGIWNIILTPNYNAAHDDHLHVDLTPGSHFYE
jgi:hypothetical protein